MLMKTKESLKYGYQRVSSSTRTAVVGAVATGLAVASNGAFAVYTMPTEATAVFTDTGSAISAMEGAAWPIIGIATVAVVGIKLFKRFINKV